MSTDSLEAVRSCVRAFIEGAIDLGALDDQLADRAMKPRSAAERHLERELAHLLAGWDDGVYDEDGFRHEMAKLLEATPPVSLALAK